MFFLLLTLSIFSGLLLGSCLNILANNLPIYLHAVWQPSSSTEKISASTFLLRPLFCSHCQQPYLPTQHSATLNYLLLKTRCTICKTSFGFRGLTLELLCGGLALVIPQYFGWNERSLIYWLFSSVLLLLACIDYYHYLLPDCLTLPLLWLGLLVNTFGLMTQSKDAIWGACIGYGMLWGTAKIFKFLRHQEGMGQGDMKLLATLGAWLGSSSLLFILLTASSLGAFVGLVNLLRKKSTATTLLPFGPFLAIAGVLALFCGN